MYSLLLIINNATDAIEVVIVVPSNVSRKAIAQIINDLSLDQCTGYLIKLDASAIPNDLLANEKFTILEPSGQLNIKED